MKKILLPFFSLCIILLADKSNAQCDLQFNNLVITSAAPPNPLGGGKCEYFFNASFDITTNSGFKYLFFHSWLKNNYPSPSIFDCSGTTPATNPGTSVQLGTAVDDPGKSFLDIGFLNLNTVTFNLNSPVNVTSNFATTYPHDNTVIVTKPSNSSGLAAFVTRTSSNVLHFDVSNIRIVINASCGSPIIVKTDIWGSNQNAPDPKAQCYICGIEQSFNDPAVSLLKICGASPFKYDIGMSTSSLTDIHVVYKLYAHDPLLGSTPHSSDPLIYTSPTITLNNSNPYDPLPMDLPWPYCCVDPWAQWDIYADVTAVEFTNTIRTPIVSIECAALPVKLKSFTATRSKSMVNLKWETVTEENSKGFDIQRKIGSGGWENIGFVNTKALDGNSNISITYEYSDMNNTRGITQYRLRQLDIDGKQYYSIIRSVRGDGQKNKTIVYPNPSNDGTVNIVFEDASGLRDVSLIDMNGRMIRQWKGVSNNTLQVNNLVTGLYTVRIINTETGEQNIEKIVVKNR